MRSLARRRNPDFRRTPTPRDTFVAICLVCGTHLRGCQNWGTNLQRNLQPEFSPAVYASLLVINHLELTLGG